MDRRQRRFVFFVLLGFLLLWGLLLHYIGPSAIVSWIGADHGYLVVFLVAAFGGVSSLTAPSYFTTIVTMAAGGLDPILLGVLGGIGVTIGDSLFFFFGRNGRVILPDRWQRRLDRFGQWLKRGPRWAIPLAMFLYAALTPFPNEFMTISIGLTGTRYRRIILPLLLGNITITIAIAWFVRGVAMSMGSIS